MRQLCYLLGYLLALPCAAFALAIVALNHVIATRNIFKILYQFFLALGWGLPALIVVLGALLAAGLFTSGRLVGSMVLIVVDVASVVIILMSPAAPRSVWDTLFLLPAVLSTLFAGLLITEHFRSPAPAIAPPSPQV
jgi:hypothetical protein